MPGKDDSEEYELVPLSPLKKIKQEIEDLKRTRVEQVPLDDLRRNIERLNEQVSKLVTVNINLQAKITELLIKDSEMIEQVTEMVDLLKKASEMEVTEAGPAAAPQVKINLDPVILELKKLGLQNDQLLQSFSFLQEYMSKTYTRSLITQMVAKPEQELPPPPMPQE